MIKKFTLGSCGMCSKLVDRATFNGEHYGTCSKSGFIRRIKDLCVLDIDGKDISLYIVSTRKKPVIKSEVKNGKVKGKKERRASI